MINPIRSLSNRIFLASAVLAVSAILAAVWSINRSVTAQAEREIERGLSEAATLVDEYRRLALAQLEQSALLVADLPKFKAAVELDDPPTVAPLATDYRERLRADVLLVDGRTGRRLAQAGAGDALAGWTAPAEPAGPVAPRVTFVPVGEGIVQMVTVPIWIDPAAPSLLGTLSVGVALDSRFAAQIKRLTDADIVFAWEGRVRAGTLSPAAAAELDRWLSGGHHGLVALGDQEYGAIVRPLAPGPVTGAATPMVPGTVVVLRSRTEGLRPLRALHRALAAIALTAVLAATLLSYLVARTVTSPIRAITATMRDLASSGDLTGTPSLAPSARWGDEDALVLANTFNAMTASLGRFQREAAQRERLSSLGRLSTVIAHEIRNPLMIIKTALRTLRRVEPAGTPAAAAVADIDEEVARLNRLVGDVLDFARPIRFTLAQASLSALCRDAVEATASEPGAADCDLRLDPAADAMFTDAERLRQALVNVLGNARQAVAGCSGESPDEARDAIGAPVVLATLALDADRVRISVRDRGPGLDAASVARVFDPFFTTKPTGTGIGLAITRNIVEGLGGTVRLTSEVGAGTEVLLELPRTATPRVTP